MKENTDSERFLRRLEATENGGKPKLAVLAGGKTIQADGLSEAEAQVWKNIAQAGGVKETDLADLTYEQKKMLWFVFGRPDLKLIR